MNDYIIKTTTEDMTKQLGERMALLLRQGNVITLSGDLGAGKTTLTKGIGKGIGVKRTINSPTFTIVKEYMGNLPLYHMDAYRLENSDEDIGFEEYFYSDGVTVVEWPSFIEEFLPAERLDIVMKRSGENEREIHLYPQGSDHEFICKELYR
ncbi:hypothetical protein J416_10946 [Gracilibacillus halophilus YIM-C55.5]|uniref:tRNA threonylcarbamoyladenosine biosynthesis protein TsaE n=1 Tax=Gracilibacillus halophilus YIM-C55.5 TaxID=1308866 RepID=N4WAX6_9BACI|nr:tRNA (adenosine(37)-N6)-threonylcarbamoyltransferase complex ATPase subunit type 1 TsaE [Gracilibacillus halophilus]ENH96414.1 hypothetical protein J416_10946 [Gracilibacillus halophilus YIM-C55.5]